MAYRKLRLQSRKKALESEQKDGRPGSYPFWMASIAAYLHMATSDEFKETPGKPLGLLGEEKVPGKNNIKEMTIDHFSIRVDHSSSGITQNNAGKSQKVRRLLAVSFF